MSLAKFPELQKFLSTHFSESDAEQDSKAFQNLLQNSTSAFRARVSDELNRYLESAATLVEDLGMSANRWFSDGEEARLWVRSLQEALSQNSGASTDGESLSAKDSNGAELLEGDSVTVVKDLKVKGGSSDLKRGTLIKKIHLTSDPNAIECSVNGSTLVLKTMFLKKA